MKLRSRILMFAASTFLLMMFLFPLWKITLIAPQYPDGIGLYIWLNKITGDEPSTLQNINILNHYIGMKKIHPDSIPELQFMQYIVVGLAALAILFGFLDRWQLNLSWLIILLSASVLAIYDFYLWEYDYGHNLDPNAALKFEGIAYQPPLIGKKQILNFTAVSWPRLGAISMGLSILMGAAAFYLGFKRRKHA